MCFSLLSTIWIVVQAEALLYKKKYVHNIEFIRIFRITGLDPARALFEGTFSNRGLDRTCARFVDIIHTDPGGYGISKPKGTVDFWPNYAGNGGTQPGCPSGDFEMFSPEGKNRTLLKCQLYVNLD